jgi:MFS transporter, DHA2 family, multidrug resistance protein
LVISLDNTVLNIALPSLAADLQASTSELLWVVDAYVLVFASLLLTMGALSDRMGRKRTLQIGVVLFAFGSLVAANAASVEILIGARAFLGFAAGH